MALQLQFGTWVLLGTTASVDWQVTDPSGDGISEVFVEILKDGQPDAFVSQGQQGSGTLVLDAVQYSGNVTAKLQTRDFSGAVEQIFTFIPVANFVAPTPPSWVSFEEPQAFSIHLFWQTVALSTSTTTWRIVNTKANLDDVVLGEFPLATRDAVVATPLVDLNLVKIYGIDAFGNISAPSPSLAFSFDPHGPQVALAAWVVNAAVATIAWVTTSDQFITDVRWTLHDDDGHTLTGHGLPLDEASIPVTGYQGNVYLSLTITDQLQRTTTITSQTGVYNVAPPRPTIEVVEVGMHFVRVQVFPGTPGPSPVPIASAEIFGPGGEAFEALPYIHTFGGLNDNQGYAFSARVISPSGVKSPLSDPVSITTLVDPTDVPIDVPPYTGGPFMPRIQAALTGPIRHYALQFFSDTRLRNPMAPQLVVPPAGWDAVLELFTAIGPFLGTILRNETTDEPTHAASLLVDQLADPLAKIAALSERIEFGFIFNPG